MIISTKCYTLQVLQFFYFVDVNYNDMISVISCNWQIHGQLKLEFKKLASVNILFVNSKLRKTSQIIEKCIYHYRKDHSPYSPM